MLAFVPPRLVLLSVPKTGTTALEAALVGRAQLVLRARPEIKHLSLRQYYRHVAPILGLIPDMKFRTIAVVREPADWLASWYRYRRRDELAGRPNSTAGLSFDQFVRDYLSDDRPPYARLGRQSDFLAPPDGKPGIDHLFRYEDMDRLVAFMGERLKTTITLPHINVSPPADTSLEPATRAALRERLAVDYALWDRADGP